MTPTPEQDACTLAARTTSDNLLISALAGAAKTSTLCMMARALPLTPTLCVAFNKKISEEMAMRMPSHIECKTLNSVGHGVWGKRLGRRAILDKDKTYGLVKAEADAAKGADRAAINDSFAGFLRACRKAKALGYVPDGQYAPLAQRLTDAPQFLDDIATDLDSEPDDFFLHITDKILEKSIALSYEGTIDFDDQLYMPTLFGGSWPRYPIVMVDEAQDLSILNHRMLTKLIGGRLIAVGDPNQAIYGFRGAHQSSMDVMQEEFDMTPLTLSTSFRCPKAVVEAARKYTPTMQYPEWAVEGRVAHLEEWNESLIPDGAAIICRANAPLFSMALKLIKRGRGVKIMGNELGPAIIKQMKKLGPESTPRDDLMLLIDQWEAKELRGARESRKAVIHDRADCFRVFASFGEDLSQALAYADHIFKATGQILLMSGHKSKGLEFDIVFHLDPWRIPSKWAVKAAENGDGSKLQQEHNLSYVITTRAKRELYYVNLEDFT